jgi:hypothetical protein
MFNRVNISSADGAGEIEAAGRDNISSAAGLREFEAAVGGINLFII